MVVPGAALAAQPVMKISAQPGLESFFPLFTAIYAEMGYKAEITVVPNERALLQVNAGEFDADLGRAADVIGPYPNLVYTNEPIITIDLQAWAKKGSGIVIAAPADLRPYRVGIVLGAKFEEAFTSSLGLYVEKVPSLDSLAKMLDLGRIDLVITSTAILDSPIFAVGVLVAPKLATSQAFHVLNKMHVDLIPKFDEVLRTFKADGRYLKLLSGK